MALIVQKFGGTSVGSIERIQAVAERVIQTRKEGHDVVVVLSAMNGDTDKLIQLAKSVHEEPSAREYDALISTGEVITVTLLSMVLLSMGCPARSFTAAQAGIRTTSDHKKARILGIDTAQLKKDLAEVVVEFLRPFQAKRAEFAKDLGHVELLLKTSEEKALVIANQTLVEVKEKMGL